MSSGWHRFKEQAKVIADDMSADPRTKAVIGQARTGTSRAMQGFDSAKRSVTQEDSWAEATTLLEEIVDVVVAQQAIIDELLRRTAALAPAEPA